MSCRRLLGAGGSRNPGSCCAESRRYCASRPGEIRCFRTNEILVSSVSKCVEYGADDTNAHIAQLPDGAGRIGKTGMVFAGEYDDIARPESDVLRIRVELRRWRIEEDDVELGPHFLQENAERGTGQQLLRIGRGCAGRQKRKSPEFPDGGHCAAIGPAGQNRRKTDSVGDVEDPMLSRCAQVGIDEKRTFVDLPTNYRKACRHIAATLAY